MFMALGCGCLLALGFGIAPRLFLMIAWIFSDRWDRVWQGNWFVPLLGIVFLPYTTVMYMLVWTSAGISGWDWMWIILGLLLDAMKWGQIYNNRKQVPGYSSYVGSGPASNAPPTSSDTTATTPGTPSQSTPLSNQAVPSDADVTTAESDESTS